MKPIHDSWVWSLGEFRPTNRTPWRVEIEFRSWLLERFDGERGMYGLVVRDPHHCHSIHMSRHMEWHRDGGPKGEHMYLATWSNKLASEVRVGGQAEVFQAAPFEVWAFDNMIMEHRTPRHRGKKLEDRWFARVHLIGDLQIKDVPGVCALDIN